MSVGKHIIAVAVLALGSACSRQIDADDAWVLGFYSRLDGEIGGSGYRSLSYREFLDDGTVERTALTSCGPNLIEHEPLRWEMKGRDVAVVLPPLGEEEIAPGTGVTSWQVSKAPDCQKIDIAFVRGEEVMHGTEIWTRGKACLFDVGGGQFEDCRSAWCEGGEPEVCD